MITVMTPLMAAVGCQWEKSVVSRCRMLGPLLAPGQEALWMNPTTNCSSPRSWPPYGFGQDAATSRRISASTMSVIAAGKLSL